MLVEMAIADAYGMAFEYKRIKNNAYETRINDGITFQKHPTHLEVGIGCYTDDVQLSIAIAECLLANSMNINDVAQQFINVFKRNPRKGYARGFQAFLERTWNGKEFLEKIQPDSDKSGAAMRAGVIGLIPEIDLVLKLAALQASITHNTAGGIQSAQASALMVHHQAYDLGNLQSLPKFLSVHIKNVDWNPPWQGETGSTGLGIVRAALCVLTKAKNLSDVLRLSVDIGGDTDTLAVIAMGAANLSSLKNDLHENLYIELESGEFGSDYLQKLDRDLAEKFGLPRITGKHNIPTKSNCF